MITFYSAEKCGDVCKCEFINMTFAIYGWLSLVSDDRFEYRLITKREYDKIKVKGVKKPLYLIWEHDGVVGYYTQKIRKK